MLQKIETDIKDQTLLANYYLLKERARFFTTNDSKLFILFQDKSMDCSITLIGIFSSRKLVIDFIILFLLCNRKNHYEINTFLLYGDKTPQYNEF